MKSVQLCALTSIAVVETKIELDLDGDTCVVGDHCVIGHDHSRPLNVYRNDPKAWSKHACISMLLSLIQNLRQVKLLSFQSIRQLNGRPQSPPSPPNAVLHEWCTDQ